MPQLRVSAWAAIAALAAGAMLDCRPAVAQLSPTERYEQVIEGLGYDLESSEAHSLRGGAQDRLPPTHQEAMEVRVAQPQGLGYLPLMVARQLGLVEKHARGLGHPDLKVRWSRLPPGKAMNDALRSGLLDVAAGGMATLIHAWDVGGRGTAVRGIAALGSLPLFLISADPDVRDVAGLAAAEDPIAVPALAESHQVLLLRMAAARELGPARFHAFDDRMVALPHPEAMASLLDPASELVAHFSSPPYQYQETDVAGVHRVLDSYQLAGGPATFAAIWAREDFRDRNPRTFQAVLAAVAEAMALIRADPRQAAETYNLHSDVPISVDRLALLLEQPEILFKVTPERTMVLAGFMGEHGLIGRTPEEWKALFFPELHGEDGS